MVMDYFCIMKTYAKYFFISLILQSLLRQRDYNKFVSQFVSLQVTTLKKILIFQRGRENTKTSLSSEKE